MQRERFLITFKKRISFIYIHTCYAGKLEMQQPPFPPRMATNTVSLCILSFVKHFRENPSLPHFQSSLLKFQIKFSNYNSFQIKINVAKKSPTVYMHTNTVAFTYSWDWNEWARAHHDKHRVSICNRRIVIHPANESKWNYDKVNTSNFQF